VPRGLVIGLFILVIASLVVLIKWEFKRAKHSLPRISKDFQRQLDERQKDPGNTYVAPAERTTRAFQNKAAHRWIRLRAAWIILELHAPGQPGANADAIHAAIYAMLAAAHQGDVNACLASYTGAPWKGHLQSIEFRDRSRDPTPGGKDENLNFTIRTGSSHATPIHPIQWKKDD
jgi:hypothetical protein